MHQAGRRAADRERPLTIGPRSVSVTVGKRDQLGGMKRLVAFWLDQDGSVLVWRSQPPCRKEFCLVPESTVPVIIWPPDSHVTN